MDILSNTVALSRMQFALTAIFHMLWPVLTTGMAIYLVIVEGLWLKTRNPDYYRHARFWSKLYVLNFGIGVASGLPMEFQFGTNWHHFRKQWVISLAVFLALKVQWRSCSNQDS
jgi:cytochrome d ubiquinol oxidase subunit I